MILLIALYLPFHFYLSLSNESPQISPLILYYEPVFYEILPMAIEGENEYYRTRNVRFRAFGRFFDLSLITGSQVLSSYANIIIQSDNKTERMDVERILPHLVSGKVVGEPGSYVQGHMFSGVFDGIITLNNDSYFIEPSEMYFDHPTKFKSVIYRASDLNHTAILCPNDPPDQCQPLRFDYVFVPFHGTFLNLSHSKQPMKSKHVLSPNKEQKGNVCTLKVVADHTFYERTALKDVDKTIFQMMILIQQADKIFSETDWNSDGKPDDIRLQILSIQIWQSSRETDYKLGSEDLSANDFLTVFSEYDFSHFCVGLGLVSRMFPDRVVGLAYTAPTQGLFGGGICSRRQAWLMDLSVNTAFASIPPLTERAPRVLGVVAVTHELGHAFGSYHDPIDDKRCSPSQSMGGHFIMAPFAVSGRDPNNLKFSPCSRDRVAIVLKMRNSCFLTMNQMNRVRCGNGIVDKGEECDCGDSSQCHMIDPCCIPRGHKYACHLQPGFQCSARNATCCKDCFFISPKDRLHCNKKKPCEEMSVCNGLSSQCPAGIFLPDGTVCRKGLGTCENGQCIQRVCTSRSLKDCECTQLRYSCYICCLSKDLCQPAYVYGIMAPNSKPYVKLDGDSCDQGMGRCVNNVCKEIGQPLYKGDLNDQRDENHSPNSMNAQEIITKALICTFVVGTIMLLLVGTWCLVPSRRTEESQVEQQIVEVAPPEDAKETTETKEQYLIKAESESNESIEISRSSIRKVGESQSRNSPEKGFKAEPSENPSIIYIPMFTLKDLSSTSSDIL